MSKKSFLLGVLLLGECVESGIFDCFKCCCASRRFVYPVDNSIEAPVVDLMAQRRATLVGLLKNKPIVITNYRNVSKFSLETVGLIETDCSLAALELKLRLALSQDLFPVTWEEFNRQKTDRMVEVDRVVYVFTREWLYVANIMAAIEVSPNTPAFYKSKVFRALVNRYVESENELKRSLWPDLS